MQLKIEQLEKMLNSNDLDSIYLLYGEEKFLLETCVKKISKKFGERIDGINFVKIYESNIHNLISDIQTPAFGYEKKLILVRSSGLFESQGRKKDKNKEEFVSSISEYIEQNIDDINQSIILVFIEDEVSKNKLFKTIESNGIVCDFEQLKPMQISARLKSICNAYKVNISNQDLDYLIQEVRM